MPLETPILPVAGRAFNAGAGVDLGAQATFVDRFVHSLPEGPTRRSTRREAASAPLCAS